MEVIAKEGRDYLMKMSSGSGNSEPVKDKRKLTGFHIALFLPPILVMIAFSEGFSWLYGSALHQYFYSHISSEVPLRWASNPNRKAYEVTYMLVPLISILSSSLSFFVHRRGCLQREKYEGFRFFREDIPSLLYGGMFLSGFFLLSLWTFLYPSFGRFMSLLFSTGVWGLSFLAVGKTIILFFLFVNLWYFVRTVRIKV